MVAKVGAVALEGLDGRPVSVEVEIANGLPGVHVVGLPDAAVRESHARVKAAITSSELTWPNRRVVVNLSPGDVVKEGPGFDLAIAVGVMAAQGEVPQDRLPGLMAVGELGLDGSVRPVRGVLSVAMAAKKAGASGLICAAGNASEAALVPGLAIHPATSLLTLRSALVEGPLPEHSAPTVPLDRPPPLADLADVRGQHLGRRALEVAAAGGHHLILVGPPGSGKSMLARRLPGVLPPLSEPEALEVTRIHSVAGLLDDSSLVVHRPFRAPHHGVSMEGLVGGGSRSLRPGEVSIAHHGVLFLDEMSAFSKRALEALREPLEEGRIRISRQRRACTFPARFQLVAATNPCPCGFRDDPAIGCRCGDLELSVYDRRLSGPLLDRIDLLARLPRPAPELLLGDEPAEPSSVVASRVTAAREEQQARLAGCAGRTFGDLGPAELRAVFQGTPQARSTLARAARGLPLSGRGIEKVRRVALTIAGLDGRSLVGEDDIHEALSLRGGPLIGGGRRG